MKKNVLIAILLLPLFAWAQMKPTAPLPPEESKARLQQLGDSLRKYDHFEIFDRHGWIVVEKVTENHHQTYSSHYGIINDKGQTILPCEYSCIRFQDHSDLIMVAKNSHSAGFMNRQLQWVIPPKFEAEDWRSMECDDYFQYGMLVTSDSTEKYGVVDSTGREILPCRYNWVEIAGQDLLLTYYENRYGALDRHGKIIIPFDYKHLHFLGDQYIEAKKQGLYGVITTSGQEILPFIYEQIWNYEKGLFSVKQNGKWGVVDSLNNLVVPFMPAQNIHIISKLDMFELLQENGRRQLLDKNGKVLVSSYEYSIPGVSGKQIAIWGENTSTQDHLFCKIYDRNGKMVDAYNNIEFAGSKWVNDKTMIPVNRNGKWGFVNRDFQLVVPCLYDSPASGGGGYGCATSTNTELPLVLFDEQGEPLAKGPYQWICPSVNGWFQVESYPEPPAYWEGLIGFIDRYGNSTFTEGELIQIKEWYEDLFENEENLAPLSETWPEFPGGPDSLNAYLARTIQFPQDARDNGIFGTVLAEFAVEKDGQVGQVTIKVPLFPSCDEEVVRVLRQMPKWKPATNQGLPVRCFMQVPVTFKNDTLYPKPITDSSLINTLTAMLRNKTFSQEDFHLLNLEEADYFRLKNFYIVRCMLVGPSGWSSNFQHYIIMDTTTSINFYFMSLSNDMNNVYLNGNLIVNSVEYKDQFNEDENYFKRKRASFKLISTTLSPADLQVKTTTKTERTLPWEEVYGFQFH